MSLDRDELTARFAVEYAVRNGFHPENAARQGREAADALLLALTPTPAPVAPPAGPCPGEDARDDAEARKHIAAAVLAVPPPAPTPAPEAKCDWCGGPHVRDVFHAADITPAPERWPTHVRITGPKGQLSVTIGKVYEVLYFDDDRARLIIKNDDGVEWGLSNKPDEGPAFPTWAPAPCPPPVAGRGEDDVRSAAQALIDEVERMFAAPYAEGVLFHREFKALKAALSRPVRP